MWGSIIYFPDPLISGSIPVMHQDRWEEVNVFDHYVPRDNYFIVGSAVVAIPASSITSTFTLWKFIAHLKKWWCAQKCWHSPMHSTLQIVLVIWTHQQQGQYVHSKCICFSSETGHVHALYQFVYNSIFFLGSSFKKEAHWVIGLLGISSFLS